MSRHMLAATALAIALAASSAMAGDLTGADKFICSSVKATACEMGEDECTSGPPWNFNVPPFIEVDLENKTLKTPKGALQERGTAINNLVREEGLIIMQGQQQGRAFSMVIVEETGALSFAVATEVGGVVIFGVCTQK